MRAVLLGLLFATSACTAATPSRPDRFQVKHEQEIQVGGGPNVPVLGNTALDTPGAGVGLAQEISASLQNSGAKKEEVRSVTLALMRLEVTEPLRNGMPIQDLRFLDSLRMDVGATGVPEVKVAESLPPPDGGTQSPSFGTGVFSTDIPPVPGVNLRDQATSESMDVTVTVVANDKPAFSCTVKVTIIMDVELDPAGVAQSRLPGLP